MFGKLFSIKMLQMKRIHGLDGRKNERRVVVVSVVAVALGCSVVLMNFSFDDIEKCVVRSVRTQFVHLHARHWT